MRSPRHHCNPLLLSFFMLMSAYSIEASVPSASPPANPKTGQTWTSPKDGSAMIYVPAGEFTMGGGNKQEPEHKRQLKGFWIDKCEITNEQFAKFVHVTSYVPEGAWVDGAIQGKEKFPVIGVTWKDACAYAKWAGERLPLNAEWERAARGTDGRVYPWGNEWDASRAVVERKSAVDVEAVGTHPRDISPIGCLDMAGNAQEWCLERYRPDDYERYIKGDHKVQSVGFFYVTRTCGASSTQETARCSNRGWGTPGWRSGFRCVIGPDPMLEPLDIDLPCEMNPAPHIYRTPKVPAQPKPGDVWVCPKNGAEMVYVSAGEFKSGYVDNLTTASTGAYWISRYPVTVEAYRQFVKAEKYKPLEYWECYDVSGHESHPACGLAYEDAEAYAKWVGQRIPTSNEWEKAARGIDGRPLPWGKVWNSDWWIPFLVPAMQTVPNATRPGNRSPYGIWDMCSSNDEWVDEPSLAKILVKPGSIWPTMGKLYWRDPEHETHFLLVLSSDFSKLQSKDGKPCKRLMCACFGPMRDPGDTVRTVQKYIINLAGKQADGKTYISANIHSQNYVFRCVLDARP